MALRCVSHWTSVLVSLGYIGFRLIDPIDLVLDSLFVNVSSSLSRAIVHKSPTWGRLPCGIVTE